MSANSKKYISLESWPCWFCGGEVAWGSCSLKGCEDLKYIYCTKCGCRTVFATRDGQVWLPYIPPTGIRPENWSVYEGIIVKPCPICCGGTYIRCGRDDLYSVVCEDCKLKGSPQKTPEKAIEMWNCRTEMWHCRIGI